MPAPRPISSELVWGRRNAPGSSLHYFFFFFGNCLPYQGSIHGVFSLSMSPWPTKKSVCFPTQIHLLESLLRLRLFTVLSCVLAFCGFSGMFAPEIHPTTHTERPFASLISISERGTCFPHPLLWLLSAPSGHRTPTPPRLLSAEFFKVY